MIIKNGCVTLRAIEEKDFDILFGMINSPEIEKALGNFSLPVNEKQQREWISNYRNTESQIRLMIELDNGNTIGVMMLYDIDMKNGTAEVGYKTMASREDRLPGDMYDALTGMMKYAFEELRLNCLVAHTVVNNEASERLLRKVGFRQEGVLRQRVYQSNTYWDMKAFSVLKSEFAQENGGQEA